ncbi:CDP-abequose synthase [Dissulfurispira thermophila]|uniref:CDP-abequose synthase n=2 Tax=root TaxID=1 RepID=A0A7G1H246_9BACT|nr:NAD-dependent epimerase/dehydratase family protein [Dissulfurispira thermophila]BCB96309.1 CDP-abequose synthase [Dissulfurispira thermophila]
MNTFTSTDRILIIGGTGFIGRHLTGRCLKDTPYVTCISLGNEHGKNFSKQNVEFIQADITNKEQLRLTLTLSNKHFDYVFNLGGYIDHTPYLKGGRRLIESHFIGLMNLVDCLDKERLKGFVQIGSSDEYGNAPAPQKETMREMPISPYSLSKAAASQFIQMLSHTEGFPGVVLRFFLVYGPGQDDKRFLPQIIKACLKNEEFKTSEGAQLRDFCYVEDVVDAMIMAALSGEAKGHVINIASGVPLSIRKVVQKVVTMIGGGKPLWGSHPYREGENMELYADISLAKKLLGWKPQTSLEDGLKKTINYYRSKL